MITLDSIAGNIIAEIIFSGLSYLISLFIPKLLRKQDKEKSAFKVDPLSIGIFLTLISVINLVLNISFWNNQKLTTLFALTSLLFGGLTYYIYDNQCPSCKRFIRAKNKIGEEVAKEFTKEIPYQPMKIIKYSNGRIKKSYPFGKRKVRTEKWERKTEFYKCNCCGYNWDSGQKDHPIFIEKERHDIVNTSERDPEEPTFY